MFSFLSSLIPMGDPKSVIDLENQRIILRRGTYPKNGSSEFVIFGDTIEHNTIKRHGIVTETFQISQITQIELAMFAHHSGCLDVFGIIPKYWCRTIMFNGTDMFVAHAAYTYIVAKRQNDHHNPLKSKISPLIVEARRQLEEGEGVFNEETLEGMRRNGVSFLEPKPRATSIPPVHESAMLPSSSAFSVADELLKLKNLVNAGVITLDEFEREKRRLLG